MASRTTVHMALTAAVLLAAGSCAGKSAVLDLHAVVLYDKPTVESVSHTIDDRRSDGEGVLLRVTLMGDEGLVASFDVSPGVADRVAMEEIEPGMYVGQMVFPDNVLGGPYTVVGRLRHTDAGEVVVQDPKTLFITLPELDR